MAAGAKDTLEDEALAGLMGASCPLSTPRDEESWTSWRQELPVQEVLGTSWPREPRES